MKLKWLGNSCVEILDPQHIVIDPNYIQEPEEGVKKVFVTHEHTDHIDVDDLKKLNAPVVAPQVVLDDFNLEGTVARVGDDIDGVKVLDSWCYKAKESVSYFYNGMIHPGDSDQFPDVEGVKLAFTACFPDFYDEYVKQFKRLKPDLVIPIHYKEEKIDNARGLKERLDKEGINSRIVDVGEIIEI